ncbi:hypothetical protein C6I20_03115 [Aeromicrobium sp. A1-2]|uniref:hypothetical protein n=1 Tax=Aeromicrobium sp. A1-2 TaxID=2107713 RepID=UPI000E4A603F|nr:hypothetical protein [Aeromicrobium sp. A1-2]AXT84282.1 hypothetical protein C6I20_03115 [Aeromicrobium sp. A1-2]
MSGTSGLSVAIVFVWLGMVAAISFIEAPLKFRAPDVTIRIGLGIGRLVFRALNTIELVFAVVIVGAVAIDRPDTWAMITLVIPVVVLAVQLGVVRPRLTRRSDLVLSGQDPPGSRVHYVYIALETAKVIALALAGIVLLNS